MPSIPLGSGRHYPFEGTRFGLLLEWYKLRAEWTLLKLEYFYLICLREFYRTVLRVLRWLRANRH